MSPDAFERVKKLRHEVPEISPAAVRVADYPHLPPSPLGECVNAPPEATGLCASKKEEDVSFACPHVEPQKPCCDPYKRDTEPSPC